MLFFFQYCKRDLTSMYIVVSIKCSSTFGISIDKFPKMIFLSQIINEKLST